MLRYGDGLAGALWRQRQRTLHTAETLRSYEQLRAEHEQVSRSAETDALTGVPNRRAFDRELTRHAGTAAGSGAIAVLVIDLDKFKPLNDTLGHAAGDEALQAVAAALTGQVRGHDLLARTGGDEFCALLAGADAAGATQVAERMVHAVRDLDLPSRSASGSPPGPARRSRTPCAAPTRPCTPPRARAATRPARHRRRPDQRHRPGHGTPAPRVRL